MASVYSVETSSVTFITPPSSPPPLGYDPVFPTTNSASEGSPPTPKRLFSAGSASHNTPPLIHRAPSSTVDVSLAAAVGSTSSSTSKKSPVPIQTFPSFMDSTSPGRVPESSTPISLLEDSLKRSLKIAQGPIGSTPSESSSIPQNEEHPFAHSNAKLELLPSSTYTTAHGIDLEEEARLYAELMEGSEDVQGTHENLTDDFSRLNVPAGKARFRTLSTPTQPSHHKLTKHRPPVRAPGHLSRDGSRSADPSSSSFNHHLDLAYPYKPYQSSRSSNRIKPSVTFPFPSSSSRPPISSNPSYAESVLSADIYLADNTASGVGLGFTSSHPSSSSSVSSVHRFEGNAKPRTSPYTRGLAGGGLLGRGTPPPLFAQDVKIDGWLVVGEGAEPRSKTASQPNENGDSQTSTSKADSHHHHMPIRLGASQVGSLRQLNTSSVGAYVVYDVVITIRSASLSFTSSTSAGGLSDSSSDASGPSSTQMRVLKRYSDFEQLREAIADSVGRIGGIEHHLASQIPPLPPKSAWSRFRPAFLEKRRKLLEFWLTRVLLHPEIGGREVVREWVLR